MPIKFPVTLGVAALLFSSAAWSAPVSSSWRGYTSINKGVFDLGLENMLLFRSNSTPIKGTSGVEDGEVSASEFAYQGGLSGRYFVIRNLAVGASANFFMRSRTDETDQPGPSDEPVEITSKDSGFIGFAMAHYYIRLGNSFFITPGLGGGYFTGTRETPVAGTGNQVAETTISGPAGRADLGAVFYAGPQFNLKAGLTFIGRFGQESFEDTGGAGSTPDPVDFTSIDGAFNIGLGYTF
jgi:hypothetical protein